jgi:hypothetical protein
VPGGVIGLPAPAAGDTPPQVQRRRLAFLQAAAGNRAANTVIGSPRRSAGIAAQTPAIPPVQRVLSTGQAAALAGRLHEAMAGWGTDEEAVYGALSGRTRDDIAAISDAYNVTYEPTLRATIEDEFSGEELTRALRLLEGHDAPAEGADDASRAAATAGRAREIAIALRGAIYGAGTEEDEIFNALEGRSPEEIGAIKRQYLDLTHNTLEEDLVDDLSGDELARALELLGVRNQGEFTNTIWQHMTEGMTTVVRGRFRWSLTDDRLEVDVGVRFVPEEGITVPLALWQSQIDSVWNQFAITEPGGRRVVVDMELRDDPGESRTIDVVHNHVEGHYGFPDRANAGMYYPVMPEDTAPHEFGHLIGLPDEYQRTHQDFRDITGEDRTGPRNESGRTELAIAQDLHEALYQDEEARRAPDATTLLTSVGLISAGTPQQGDFAQAVMAAYDEEYGGAFSRELLDAIIAKVPEENRWTLLTVFSYASGTVMGDQPMVGTQPHEHPVMPRHLREFRDIVARQWPDKTWEVSSR